MLEPYEFEVCTYRDKFKDFTSLTSEHTPFCYRFKRFDDKVQHYNLSFDTESGTTAVCEYIAIDTSLRISLSTIYMLFNYLSSAMDKFAPLQGSACLNILYTMQSKEEKNAALF